MKKTTIVAMVAWLLASLPGANAATTLTAWTFDNLPAGANSNPRPAAGFGSASALGLGNAYNNTNSISNPDVQSLAGSSSGGANCWRVRGNGAPPHGGNGWSTNAPIGSQGVQFAASTAGYYKISASFDVYATPDAEADLLVQYTTEGSIWHNATITSAGTLGVIANNTDTNVSTVIGSYVILTNNGTTGWNNQISVDFTGISGIDNNPNFAIRIVNASTGTNCVDTTGAVYNNTSGSWSFDNVVIQGVSIDTITEWTFDSYGSTNPVFNPVPEFSSGNYSLAQALGFNTSYTFSDGTVGSTNDPDTTAQAGSSTGNSGPICWRVRGQGPGNGWNSQSPTGSQGAEFDVSTVNYSDIVVNFDLYFTTQAEAKMQVEYTTDGTTWNNAPNLAYGANPTFIQTNSVASINYSPDTVTGTYFYETTGQNWYNNLVVDFTGVPGVANNPSFGIRVVNAAQNGDCVAFNGGSYNNSSGNCRFDNVTFGGQFNGSVPPALAYAANATVDGPFTNTFTDDAIWRSKITAIYVNGSLLTNTAYATNLAGALIFTPAKSTLLQASGVKSIVIFAAGYSNAKVTQPLAAGLAKKLAVTTQAAGPSASGGTLIANPVLAIVDQYGNGTTNPYANVTVTAAVGGTGSWTLGGDATQPFVNGQATFTNLSATLTGSAATVSNYLAFTVTGYGPTATNFNSSTFNIGAPPVPFTPGNLAVLQIDTLSNNTTFSMIEVKPSAANQTAPVNIIPISATGTNALRQSSAGSTGRLCLSDDGTLLCFAAFADDSAATPDETLNLNRAVGTLNYTNAFTEPFTYTSISLGGSQARACCTLDDISWIVDDKGGLYYGSGTGSYPNINALNNVVVKTFGGVPYVETQKTANGSPIPVVYALALDTSTGIYDTTIANNLGTDPVASDFYLVSTNGGATFDILYINDQVSSSQGVIKKYSWANDIWNACGAFTNATGVDGLFATTNGSGGVYLFYSTGAGGTAGNSIVRVTDSAGWNQPINIISSNVIYTAGKTASIKGLTFVPQLVAYNNQLIPPPVLTAQNGAKVNGLFSVTNTPDDPAWRAAITGITVNGATLPAAAYDLTQAGLIVFNPSQSALLQSSGSKSIVFSATGYSTNSIAQGLGVAPAAQLVITRQPSSPIGDGGALGAQPVVKVEDLYGNVVTNSSLIAAAPVQNTWTLGGTSTVTNSLGVATYAGLTAFSTNAINGAAILFATGGLTVTSSAFNIPAPIKSQLGGVRIASGKVAFNFTNFTGLSYTVLATNLLTAPVSTWPAIGTAVESPAGSGNYQFTNTAATNAELYYILRQP
jgi:hypothetical protein